MASLKTKKGTILTRQVIDDLAREAEAGYDLTKAKREKAGRPSLGRAGESPRIAFRASSEIYKAARGRANREGRPLSDLAREALTTYLEKV